VEAGTGKISEHAFGAAGKKSRVKPEGISQTAVTCREHTIKCPDLPRGRPEKKDGTAGFRFFGLSFLLCCLYGAVRKEREFFVFKKTSGIQKGGIYGLSVQHIVQIVRRIRSAYSARGDFFSSPVTVPVAQQKSDPL
jgi:hypothetical protein